MSNVGGDQPCTRFESNPTEDAKNQMQQETTIEAPEHGSKKQGPPSETKHEPPSDGQSSEHDEDNVVLQGVSCIDITVFSPGQTSTVKDKAKIKALKNQPTPTVTEVNVPLAQQPPPAVIKLRSQLSQHAESASVEIRSQLTPQAPLVAEARMKSQLTHLVPSATTAEGRLQFFQQAESASAAGMRSQLTQKAPSAVTTEMNPKLSQQAESAAEARMSSFVTQYLSAAARKIWPELTQQAEPASAAEIKSPNTQLEEARMRSYITEFLSSAAEDMRLQLIQQAKLDSSAEKWPRLDQLAPSTAEAVIKPQFTQQAAADRMRSHISQVPSTSAAELKSQLTQKAAAARMRSRISQIPSLAAARIRSHISHLPSASAAEMRTQHAQKAPSAGGMSHFFQQASSAVAGNMPQLTKQTPSFVAGMEMQLNEQAVAGSKALSSKTPSDVDGATAQLPSVPSTNRPITQQKTKAVRKVKLTAACLPSWNNLTMVEARRGRSSVSRAPPNTEDSLDLGKRLNPSVRDLPEINVQNINKGIKGHRFQNLSPSQTRQPPYRSLTERMYLDKMMKVVDITKEKKKKAKKKKRTRYACDDDDMSEDLWTTSSSSDEQKSPPKSIPSSPELMFHLEL